jgi:hypothetical protein
MKASSFQNGRREGLCIPVVYIVFNRPDMVMRTFPAIREQRPRQLYLIADGPRASKPNDPERCAAARKAVESLIDWDCEVVKDYSEINLGAGKRIASGITAALQRYGEAIIIEDDILPHSDFFSFCAEALNRYRDDPNVMGISGYNPIDRYLPGQQRAVFSRSHLTWGWATWHRAWKDYRFNLEGWHDPVVREGIKEYAEDELYFQELVRAFTAVEEKTVNAWDYQYIYTMLYERRCSLVSSVNLVENIGFVADSTHTFYAPTYTKNLAVHASPSSKWPASSSETDGLFDRLHTLVYVSGSEKKIRLLRLLARFSRRLTALALRYKATARTNPKAVEAQSVEA